MTKEGNRLDPANWDDYRKSMHDLLETCLDRLSSARDLPWHPKPDNMGDQVSLPPMIEPESPDRLFDRISQDIMPYATGNTHPRFFGWVQGGGSPLGVAAELVAATMNSNCGGRDHGATEVERSVINWLCGLAGLPETAFGILTSGTSHATILALSAARYRLFGPDIRTKGVKAFPDISLYAAAGAHSCFEKALEVLGYGSDALRTIPLTGKGQMDLDALQARIAADRAAGIAPLAVIATAGSVNTGNFDPIADLADLCEAEDIWLHVDGAFGFWALLAEAPWSDLCAGIGRVQSIACDFHKWMSVPYDCGACLISDSQLHRDTFLSRPSYLESQNSGLGGGDLWFCDYGLELSRGFKALKVWATLQGYGTDALGAYVTDNCRQARLMGELATASDVLELACPVVSNVCCIRPIKGDASAIAARLQLSGEVVFSTTRINGENCLRAALVNHRTTSDDIRLAVEAVEREVRCSSQEAKA
ncbi:pyridoxal phosphate-dependent decarboxylase family protein [Coralliovum pocilloporae]|uniref:pyridoxal phosphate-dependent decarboxylase family protein n=1 Tax=Coralliovum pocilloporae TaxID=3066369 RepID=UPI003306B31D